MVFWWQSVVQQQALCRLHMTEDKRYGRETEACDSPYIFRTTFISNFRKWRVELEFRFASLENRFAIFRLKVLNYRYKIFI